jgi:hypothetical protein
MQAGGARAGQDAAWEKVEAVYKAGDLSAAEALAEARIEELPGHLGALHMLGMIALRTGRIDQSVARLREAAERAPAHAWIRFHLGKALFRAGLYAEAVLNFSAAMARDPAHPHARQALITATLYDNFTRAFLSTHGHAPNIASPQTFNDHILHRIVHDRDPRLNTICDKIAVRDFIASRVGAALLTPMIGAWDQPEDIPWAQLPDRFALKSSHASGQCILVRDKAALDLEAVMKTSRDWLAQDYGITMMEWAYAGLPRRLIVEPIQEAPDGGDLLEPQVFTFNGRAALILILTGDKSPGRRRGAWFTVDGRRLDMRTITVRSADLRLSDADRQAAVAAAERVAQDFSSMRVDFYLTRDGLKIGELTPFTQGGRSVWAPPERDAQLGRLWRGDFDLSFLPDFVA